MSGVMLRSLATLCRPITSVAAAQQLRASINVASIKRFSSAAGDPPSSDYEISNTLQRFRLPPGIDDSKFGLYEIADSSKDYRHITGENAILAVHGPTDQITSGGKMHEGGGGGMFAVIGASGTQYKVTAGDVLYTNRIEGEINSQHVFNDVLLVGTIDWSIFGRPLIKQASVVATIEEQTKSAKVMVTKFKKRKGYRRRKGHRQPITRFRIDQVVCAVPSAEMISEYRIPYDATRPPLPNVSRLW